MIGLQWRPGKPERKPQPAPVVITEGPSTPAVERTQAQYDPIRDAFPQFFQAAPESPKRKRGRPRKA